MKLIANLTDPPIAGLLTSNYIKSTNVVEVEWAKETLLKISNDFNLDTSVSISRYLARIALSHNLFGFSPLDEIEINHWLSFSIGPMKCRSEYVEAVSYLNQVLGMKTYLVGKALTIADFGVFEALYSNTQWRSVSDQKTGGKLQNLSRWYEFITSLDHVQSLFNSLPEETKPNEATTQTTGTRKEEGKFVDLPGAEVGKVVVRFPPEASGYLHIGHAKAALLNQYYQEAFKGKLIMRFDDTNPAKEKVDFEKVILEDLEMLQIKPDLFTHTSQYFDLMLQYCEQLITAGKAYVDDTEPEIMKQEREQRTKSKNWNNTVEQNIKLWEEMKKGSELGQKCCVRARIDMDSPNGCMRDPTIYRCKNEPHPRTGTKYKVYPTYDFACPIVDSIEGVTHCLRTMEYHDRDDQFYWFIDALGLRKPYIWEYSRLNMMNTVLSKRKLTWFVEQNIVDGWDDPRFPTVRGVLRRGMTVEGLKQFIIAQGSSRSVVMMEWDKIWSFNKKVIDPLAPRYTAVEKRDFVRVFVNGATDEVQVVAKHPKNPEVGNKSVWTGPTVLIDATDAATLKVGENTTFINWGNLLIKKINSDGGKIVSVEVEPNLSNKDYKKTLKLTWLAETQKAPLIPCYCVYFDHIINKAVLGKDEDFKQYIGHTTRVEVEMLGDPELANVKKSDIIQLQRKGFFICDSEYRPPSIHSSCTSPIILFAVPDGHTRDMPTVGPPKTLTTEMSSKEKAQSAKGKLAEKSPQQEASPNIVSDAASIHQRIVEQGDKIRVLKGEKAAKNLIDVEVKVLLGLKADFKSASGLDWVPGITLPNTTPKPVNITPKPVVSGNQADDLLVKIAEQGDKVRQLKEQKAGKEAITAEVQTLLSLKSQYKTLTGTEWTPALRPSAENKPSSNNDRDALLAKIAEQGNKVRQLKSEKAAKNITDAEVQVLLALKKEFKTVTGEEWKPDLKPSLPAVNASTENKNTMGAAEEVSSKISAQGDKVRKLKSEKAAKNIIDVEVKSLIALKNEYKSLTGKDWKPEAVQQVAAKTNAAPDTKKSVSQESVVKPSSGAIGEPERAMLAKKLEDQIALQGNVVRDLKASKSSKEAIDEGVKILLELKAQYKELTGTELPSAGGRTANKKESKEKTAPPKKAPAVDKNKQEPKEGGPKKQTRLGLEAAKEDNLPDWYSQVITKGELIEYYDVSGCYILRPWSFAIWEAIQSFVDGKIKKLGVQNCYFPIFVSRAALEKEKTHIADFAPEVAWVTKSGESDLAEHIAVRPTSETGMYPAYAKWIQSYRDLPIKLNQWNNVVRWEFKHPQPFLRTREFLWQEGHSAFASYKEAEEEVFAILDIYAQVYTDLLAIPVVKGRKTEKEKFAGGDFTTTVEAFVSASGRAIQGATSHHLGQNFAKMFDIIYEDPETQEKMFVFQNSWGITTRTIGVMIMIHADNQGLVLPPRVASVQVIITPCGITASLSDEDKTALISACEDLERELRSKDVRVRGDYRDNYSPGWKFNHWELKGVPIRVELGPKDLKQKQLVAVRRDTGDKVTLSRETAVKDLVNMLEVIHQSMFDKASKELNSHKVVCTDWAEFCQHLDNKRIILAPFCGDIPCEDRIKQDSARDDAEAEAGAPAMGAKSLCIPFEQPTAIKPTDRCIHSACKNKPKQYTLFGRSY